MRIILLLLLFGWLKWIHALDMTSISSKPGNFEHIRDKRQSQYIEYWPTMLTHDADCSESKVQIMPATSYPDDSCSENDMLGHKPQQPVYNAPSPQRNRNGGVGGVLLNVYDLPTSNKKAFENEAYRSQEITNWQQPTFRGVVPNEQIMPENVAQLGAPYAPTPNDPQVLRNNDYHRPSYRGKIPRPLPRNPKYPKNRSFYTTKPLSNKRYDISIECKDVYLSEEDPNFAGPIIQGERKMENITNEMFSDMLQHFIENFKQRKPQHVTVINDDVMRIPSKGTASTKQEKKKKDYGSKESRNKNEGGKWKLKGKSSSDDEPSKSEKIGLPERGMPTPQSYEENSASTDATETPMLEEPHVTTDASMNSQSGDSRGDMSQTNSGRKNLQKTNKTNKSKKRRKQKVKNFVNKNRGSHYQHRDRKLKESVDQSDLHDEFVSTTRGNDDSTPILNDSTKEPIFSNEPTLEQPEELRKGTHTFRDDVSATIEDQRENPIITQMPSHKRKSRVFNDASNQDILGKVHNPKQNFSSSQPISEEDDNRNSARIVPPQRMKILPRSKPLQPNNQMVPRKLKENNSPINSDNTLLGQIHKIENITNTEFAKKSEKSSEQQRKPNDTEAERKRKSESVEERADQLNQDLNPSTKTNNDTNIKQSIIGKPESPKESNKIVAKNKLVAPEDPGVSDDVANASKIAVTNEEKLDAEWLAKTTVDGDTSSDKAEENTTEAASKQTFTDVSTEQTDLVNQTVTATVKDTATNRDPTNLLTLLRLGNADAAQSDEPAFSDTRYYNYYTQPEFKNRSPKLKKPYYEPIAYETKPTKKLYDHEMAAQIRRAYEPQPARPNYAYASAAERLPTRFNNHAYDVGPTTIQPYASQLMREEEERPLLAAPQPSQSEDPTDQPKSFYFNKIVKAAEQKVITHASPQRIKDLRPFEGFRAYDACNNAQHSKQAADNLLGSPHGGTVGSLHGRSFGSPNGGTIDSPYRMPIGSPYGVTVGNPHDGSTVGDPSPIGRVTSGNAHGGMPVTAIRHQSPNTGGNLATGVVNTAIDKLQNNGYGKAYEPDSCDSSENSESIEHMNYQRPGPAPQFSRAKFFT